MDIETQSNQESRSSGIRTTPSRRARTGEPGSTPRRVRDQIRENPGADCSLEFVAQQLSMTPRSLRRHLHMENSSFRELRNDVRKHLANRYLAETCLALSSIAHQLGFSDQASFTRAYRDWTGRTPGEVRRNARKDRSVQRDPLVRTSAQR